MLEFNFPPGARMARALPGLALCMTLALAALWVSSVGLLQGLGVGALTIAILAGLGAGNALPGRWRERLGPGVAFARQWLLRAGVVLYGLRLTLHDVAQIGVGGVLVDVVMVASTLALAGLVGTRLLRMDAKGAVLVGMGSAVCGAAAILAAEPVVRGRAEQVSVAVGTVVFYGTLAILLYPLLFALNAHGRWLPGSAPALGMYTGATVHEVAQVIATAHPLGQVGEQAAVTAKMVRVLLLLPVLVVLSRRFARHEVEGARAGSAGTAFPWFVAGFAAVVAAHSLIALPQEVVAGLACFDNLVLACAMAGLGLSTHASAVRAAGSRPLILAGILFVWLMAGGAWVTAKLSPLAAH